jgi:hypothetical protein
MPGSVLPDGLMTGNLAGNQGLAGSLGIVLGDQDEDQFPDRGGQRASAIAL